ncbi:MAG: cyclic nucleotide-binding domain-containing protein, partial [Adlercreutzia sp.]|nr:cyclic nucleotide-binding domain-containing protein [Adlercreutzia sp.]
MEPAEFSLFGGVDPGEVPKLLARFDAHEESFEKGELLFREGDVPHEVGLVLSGALHVMQDDFWGNASIVSEVGEGDLFGASSACDPVPALDTHGLALVPTRARYLGTGRILNPPP